MRKAFGIDCTLLFVLFVVYPAGVGSHSFTKYMSYGVYCTLLLLDEI